MKVTIGAETFFGAAIDIRRYELPPAEVVRAVRSVDASLDVHVECPAPSTVHSHVGLLRPGLTLTRRTAMAAAARSRGRSAPQDEKIDRIEAELDALDPPAVDTKPARRRLANAGDKEERLRERVAQLQGKVRALREAGLDADEAETALADAARTLSEVETERVAARQALAAARTDARAARDRRQRRLHLEDRLENLRRAARAALEDDLRPAVQRAIADAPGPTSTLEEASQYVAGLAIARVAELRAPVVLVNSPFAEVSTAQAWLDAPVIEV